MFVCVCVCARERELESRERWCGLCVCVYVDEELRPDTEKTLPLLFKLSMNWWLSTQSESASQIIKKKRVSVGFQLKSCEVRTEKAGLKCFDHKLCSRRLGYLQQDGKFRITCYESICLSGANQPSELLENKPSVFPNLKWFLMKIKCSEQFFFLNCLLRAFHGLTGKIYYYFSNLCSCSNSKSQTGKGRSQRRGRGMEGIRNINISMLEESQWKSLQTGNIDFSNSFVWQLSKPNFLPHVTFR